MKGPDREALQRDLRLLAKRHNLAGVALGYAWIDAPLAGGLTRMGGINAMLVSDKVSPHRPDVTKEILDAVEQWVAGERVK